MHKAVTALMTTLMLAVAVQFFLAATGAFDSAATDEAFGPHRGLGFLILLLTVIATVLAAVARAPGGVLGLSSALLGLVVLQPVLAGVARATADGGDERAGELVFGLHGLNGLAIAVLIAVIWRRSRAARVPTTGDAGA